MSKKSHIGKAVISVALLGGVLLPALRAEAASVTLGAVASANQEVAAVGAGDANAAAVVDMTVDPVTGDVCVQALLSGLGGPLTAAHIHAGAFGVNGPVVVGLPSTGTTVSGCVVTTPAQAQAIVAAPNNFYFNAHTAASPGGAVRGQLTTTMLRAGLSGAAEVPGPGDPDGAGSAVTAVDATSNRACTWISVTNIDLPATGFHIHSGAASVAGPVVVPFASPTTAVAAACGSASSATTSGLVNTPTAFYVNVHTAPFPGGAVRGNLSIRPAQVIPVAATTPIVLVPPTVAPSTAAPTTTIAPTTTAPATTTVAPTTTTTSPPTTVAPTSAAPVVEAPPAEPMEEEPSFAG